MRKQYIDSRVENEVARIAKCLYPYAKDFEKRYPEELHKCFLNFSLGYDLKNSTSFKLHILNVVEKPNKSKDEICKKAILGIISIFQNLNKFKTYKWSEVLQIIAEEYSNE